MIVVDNNNASEDTLNKVYTRIRGLVNKPVQNFVAKRWIENELSKKKNAR